MMNLFTPAEWDIGRREKEITSSTFGDSISTLKRRIKKQKMKDKQSPVKGNTSNDSVGTKKAFKMPKLFTKNQPTDDSGSGSSTSKKKTKNNVVTAVSEQNDAAPVQASKSSEKLKKLFLLESKKKKANAIRDGKQSNRTDLIKDNSKSQLPNKSRKDRKAQSRKRRRQNFLKSAALETNEVTLSKSQKEKMLLVAKQAGEAAENCKKGKKNTKVKTLTGVTNSSYDTSVSETNPVHTDGLKKHKKHKKKKIQVNGTFTPSNKSAVALSVPSKTEDSEKMKKKKKKKKKKNKQQHEKGVDTPNKSSTTQSVPAGTSSKELKRKKKKAKEVLSEESIMSLPDSSMTEVSISHDEGSKKKKSKKNKKKAVDKNVDSIDGNISSHSAKYSVNNSKLTSVEGSISTKFSSKLSKKDKLKKKLSDVFGKVDPTRSESSVGKNTLHYLKKKRRLQEEDLNSESTPVKSKKKKTTSLKEKMIEQLQSARFRWLNEQLYLSDSSEAKKYFKEDPNAFKAYHVGYKNQVSRWPLNPLDVIIQSLARSPAETVVADFGCGEARLAESLPELKVHSLDLVASKPGVVACDMAHTPLLMESVDVVVFCLSLMGTNLNDFLLEANRVLKMGGVLKIAEVESRFEDVDNFTSELQHFGFQLKKKDFSNQLFYFMDFKKVRKASNNGKLPVVKLDACMYKKR